MNLKRLLLLGLAALAAHSAHAQPFSLASLDWEPYIGANLKDNGYVAEIAREAFKAGGAEASIEFLPWARAVKEATAGRHTGLFPEYYDESRLADFVFSDQFPGGPVGFYQRTDSKISFKTLEDLKPYTIGVVRDYVNTKEFDAAAFLRKEEGTSDELNLKKLSKGRVDLIVIDKFVGAHLLKTALTDVDNVAWMEPPLEVKPLYIAFSKKAPGYEAALAAFNKGLAELKSSGRIDQILAKHGF